MIDKVNASKNATSPILRHTQNNRHRKIGFCVALAVFAGVGILRLQCNTEFLITPRERTVNECSDPMKPPTLCDQNATLRENYRNSMQSWSRVKRRKHRLPKLRVIENGTFVMLPHRRSSLHVQGSAWNKTYTVTDRGYKKLSPKNFTDSNIIGKPRLLQGNYIAFFNIFDDVHAHIIIDHLPAIAFFRESYPESYKFILHETKTNKEMLTWLDEDFVLSRVFWMKEKEQIQTQGNLLIWEQEGPGDVRNTIAVEALRRWVGEKKYRNVISGGKQSRVLYVSRNSREATHRRSVDCLHEQDIIQAIQNAMILYDRDEELVILTGADENNRTMSLQEQFDLFATAEAIIGAHGGAFANIMWMGQATGYRPNVLEFIIGPDSQQVQPITNSGRKGPPFRKSFYFLFSEAPWVNYWHILHSPNSTQEKTYVDLRALNAALGAMWG